MLEVEECDVIELARHVGSVHMSITPNYQRVAEEIRRRITSGELKPGDKLPSTSQLMAEFQVGNTAIRNAMLILRSEGWVEGHQGKGVFVSTRNPESG